MSENPTVNGGSWNEKSVKISQISAGDEKWASVSSAATGKRKTETSAWGQDSGDANGNGKDWGVSLVGRTWRERPLFHGISKLLYENVLGSLELKNVTTLGCEPFTSSFSVFKLLVIQGIFCLVIKTTIFIALNTSFQNFLLCGSSEVFEA